MGRPFLAPEILQISSMDCGVAAVSCLLSGFGVDANYEKLREACQTTVDGTSIDALEELCNRLGVDVCQHVVPHDLVTDAMAGRFPLIAVTEPSAGRLHFIVIWRKVGDLMQVMDPYGGRHWKPTAAVLQSFVRHRQRLSFEDWREWFPTSSFREALERSARLLLTSRLAGLVSETLGQADPHRVAATDAALRVVRKTERYAGKKGKKWYDALFERSFAAALAQGDSVLPPSTWAVRVFPEGVVVDGGVLLAVAQPDSPLVAGAPVTASKEIVAALGARKKSSLLRSVLETLGPSVVPLIVTILLAMGAVAIGSAVELLVYRTAFDVPRLLTTPEARVGASTALIALLALLFGLEGGIAFGVHRLGRYLEMQLRIRTLWAMPRVEDEFVKSRPTSDLAYRAQALSRGALLIPSLGTAVAAGADLVVTFIAIALLDFRYAVIVLVGAALFLASWLTTRTKLQEIDTRLQVHASRMLNVLLDALRGVRPLRLHGYQDAFRDDQRRELSHWRESARAQVEATSILQARYTLLGVLLLGVTFATFLWRHADARQFVVLAFWSFRIPPIITRLVQYAQTFPQQRNAVDRLLEITQYVPPPADDERPLSQAPTGVGIQIRGATVVLGGHTVLEEVHLDIPAGQHVAVVGASGSGKSTLVGLLLGLFEPVEGSVWVDGLPLDRETRQSLRATTIWLDPAIQLWNDTIGANLEYACRGYSRRPALEVLESSDLLGVLASVERGLDARVGAEGAFVSGGEGQRIRTGRALFRDGTRLALLDEPFRGLDRTTRHRMLADVRRAAIRATMVFVSHDISHAMSFDRVLVVDQGRIIEDGAPQELAQQESAFARLLAAERTLLDSAWSPRRWRRLKVHGGTVTEADNRA